MKKTIRIKEWFLRKAQDTATRYNCFIDVTDNSRDLETNAITADADGYVEVIAEEELKESEKAVQVRLATGSVLGSANGWKCWIPKSVIA